MSFRVILNFLFVGLLLAVPVCAEEWVEYCSYVNDKGDTVPMYFDPDSVELVDTSVFVWTTVEDPMDKGTSLYGMRNHVEINKSRIRLVSIVDAEGNSADEDGPEWEAIEDDTCDFELYRSAVDVLKSRDS